MTECVCANVKWGRDHCDGPVQDYTATGTEAMTETFCLFHYVEDRLEYVLDEVYINNQWDGHQPDMQAFTHAAAKWVTEHFRRSPTRRQVEEGAKALWMMDNGDLPERWLYDAWEDMGGSDKTDQRISYEIVAETVLRAASAV